MQDLAKDFSDESAALYALVAPLKEIDLEEKTAFKDWTINTVIRHLHIWNLAAGMSLAADGSFEAYHSKLAERLAKGAKLSAFEAEWLSGLSGKALIAAWQEGFSATAARFALADPAARVKWAGP